MASNSEANLSSDFDIDEVINWDEQNYSSKDIQFQLPQLGLPSDVKTSQNTTVTLANLGTAVATSQGAQNSSSFYSQLFDVSNNPSIVLNSKSHGFSPRQTMVSGNSLSFPTENINISSISTPNSSMLQFEPSFVSQNSFMSPMQNVQNSGNLMNVSPFDDSDDLYEGPLDKLVTEIIDRQNSERMSDPPFDDDAPVITYDSEQPSNPSPQNVPTRSVLSPNAPSRNVTPPQVPSPSITMRSSPSPNAPTHQVPSPGNTIQNLLSPNPTSRNVPVQNTKIGLPNMSSPNPPTQNAPSTMQHIVSTILSSQSSEQNLPSQSPFRLQSPASVPSSMVNTPGQTVIKGQPSLKPTPNLTIQDLSTNSTIFPSSSNQISSQSYPGFMMQNPTQTLIRQPSSTSFMHGNTQSKSVWLQSQSGNNLEGLLRMQKSIRSSSPNLNQTDFTNQLARSPSNFSSVLTGKIGSEQLDSNLPSFMTATQSSTVLFPNANDTASNLHLKLSEVSSPNAAGINLKNLNTNTTISSFNRTIESNPKTVSNHLETTVPQNVIYPGKGVSNFSGSSISSSLTGSENDDLQITSIVHANQNLTTEPLTSPGPSQQTTTGVNQFFVQNSSNTAPSTANISRSENIFSSTISQPRNVISSLPQEKNEPPSNPSQITSVFKLVPPATTTSQVNSPTLLTAPALFKTQANLATSKPTGISVFKSQASPGTLKPAGITTIKIASPSPDTSPSPNTAGFRFPPVGFKSSNPPPKAVSIQVPRTSTIRLKTSPNMPSSAFPTFKLTQGSLATSGSTPNTRPVVFTLAPGNHATLKGLPANVKDKLAGRQVIFLQQPSGQPINTPKPQPMKIVFVSDNSIRQVVSGPVKSKVPQTSATPAVNQTRPGLTVTSKMTSAPSTESLHVPPTSTENTQDSDAGSPASVNSADSDSIPIASLKQSEDLKKKDNENKDEVEHKTRGRKRRKDPNRPVKPLSSFQRFFQATQPTIRQQNPLATFAEVSKTIKEMWERLSSKDKKVYQDAWRMERVQYKKAMDEYNASLIEIDSVDGPSAKHVKTIEIKEEVTQTNPIPVSSVDIQMKTETPTITSSTAGSSSLTLSSSVPAPRSTGKPLAMMAEMANKTKLASAHAAKATGTTKSVHLGKNKDSNGVEDSGTHVVKKKTKINPIPKKLCIRANCKNPAKFTKDRGTMFCSNNCLMRYCRGVFRSWVDQRRQTLKEAT